MSLMNHKAGLAAAVAVFCAVLSSGAHAQELSIDSVKVRYLSSELSTAQGAKRVYSRIERAAQLVCHRPDTRDIRRHPDYDTCYEKAVDNAVEAIGVSTLTALHKTHSQRSAAG